MNEKIFRQITKTYFALNIDLETAGLFRAFQTAAESEPVDFELINERLSEVIRRLEVTKKMINEIEGDFYGNNDK